MCKKFLLVLYCLICAIPVLAEPPVEPNYSRAELVELWRTRIRSFLNKGIVPIIDMESSMTSKDGARYMRSTLAAMDKAGVALMVLDGYQAPKDGSFGYRWGYAVQEVVNAHPSRFILATNGGTNNNWIKGKGGRKQHFMDQTEVHVRSGNYAIMGEFEFRHYMSSHQCREGKTDRDVTVPLTSRNGHHLFSLSQETYGTAWKLLTGKEWLDRMLTIFRTAEEIS